MEDTGNIINLAEGINNFGLSIVMNAVFLIVILFVLRWFKRLIDKTIDDNSKQLKELIEMTQQQNMLLNDIAEMLKPQSLVQVDTIASMSFELAAERMTQMVYQIQDENNIDKREAVEAKVKMILQNMHEKRRLVFGNFTYNGTPLSHYMNLEWIGWGEKALLKEIYAKTKSYDRIHGEMVRLYDRISNDFRGRVRGLKR